MTVEKTTEGPPDKYLTLLHSIDQGFCVIEMIWDDKGKPIDYRFLEVNKVFEKQTGIRDAVGRTIRSIEPGQEQHWFDIYDEILKTGRPMHFEQQAQALMGGWYEVSAIPIGKNQLGVLFRDISERKHAELRQSFLLELNDAFRIQTDAASIMITAVHMLQEKLGLDRCYVSYMDLAEDAARMIYQYFRPDLAPVPTLLKLSDFPDVVSESLNYTLVFDDIANDPILSERDRQSFQAMQYGALLAAPLREGEQAPIWCMAAASVQPRHWTTEEVALVEEVAERTWAASERIRSEQASRESEEKYRTLFENMDEGYCMIQMLYDEQGKPYDWRYLRVNPAFEKHNGLSNAAGKTIRECAPDIEQKWMDIYGQVAATGESIRFEEDSLALNRVFDLYAFRIGQPEERKVAVLFSDITERKKAERALQEREIQLQQLLRQRDEFIGIASHELKTPVTSIKGYAGIIRERMKASEDNEEKYLVSRMNLQIDKLTTLINHLLDTTRIAEGQLKLIPEAFDLNELLKERLEDIRQTADRNIILQADTLLPVVADSDRIGQVITNLLTNAIKYSPKETAITLTATDTGKGVRVTVKDEGYGIPENDLQKIFERFFRVTSNNMDSYPGMGLGLYISAQIIQRHGGSINVQSTVGKGSVFSFTIPYRALQEDQA